MVSTAEAYWTPASVRQARREILERANVRDCVYLGGGTYGTVFGIPRLPPHLAGYVLKVFHVTGAHLDVPVVRAEAVPASAKIMERARETRAPRPEPPSMVVVEPTEMEVFQHDISMSEGSYDIETWVLARLQGAAAAWGLGAVAPVLVPHLSHAEALMFGMDRAETTLDDLPAWLTRMGGATAALMWPDIEHILYRVFTGIALAHSVRVVHTDLVTRNVLVYIVPGTRTLDVRIGDWGSAVEVDSETHLHAPTTAYYASRMCRAPELILGHEPFGPSVDVWAAGVLVATTLLGLGAHKQPFNAGTQSLGGEYGSADLVRAICNRLGKPLEGSLMGDLVSAYLAAQKPSPEVARRAAACTAEISALECARAKLDHPGEYAAPFTPDSGVVDAVAREFCVDHAAYFRAAAARALRGGGIPVDDASLEVRQPRSVKFMLACLLQWDPRDRPTARQVLCDDRFWSRPRAQIAAHQIRVGH